MREAAAHMGLDESWGKVGYAGAGIVLIGMHRFIVAHHCCRRSLSGAEQCWPAGLANGQVDQRHTPGLGLTAFRPDNLEHILTILAQSRSSHCLSLLPVIAWAPPSAWYTPR